MLFYGGSRRIKCLTSQIVSFYHSTESYCNLQPRLDINLKSDFTTKVKCGIACYSVVFSDKLIKQNNSSVCIIKTAVHSPDR